MRIFFPSWKKNILALPFFYFPYWENSTPLLGKIFFPIGKISKPFKALYLPDSRDSFLFYFRKRFTPFSQPYWMGLRIFRFNADKLDTLACRNSTPTAIHQQKIFYSPSHSVSEIQRIQVIFDCLTPNNIHNPNLLLMSILCFVCAVFGHFGKRDLTRKIILSPFELQIL